MLSGIPSAKVAGETLRIRSSTPSLQVLRSVAPFHCCVPQPGSSILPDRMSMPNLGVDFLAQYKLCMGKQCDACWAGMGGS